jgi:hypothetical protein
MAPRRRVPTWILIALIALGVATLPAACGSAIYVHALWEAGNRRCGDEVQPGAYGGWGVGFNGETDAFVCTVRDAKLRVVAQKEIPLEEVMGTSGHWPLFRRLIAADLESVDADAP